MTVGLAAVLALSGCGSSSDGLATSPSTASPTSAETTSAAATTAPATSASTPSEPLAGAAFPTRPLNPAQAPAGTWAYDVSGTATYDGQDLLDGSDITFTVRPTQGSTQLSVLEVGGTTVTETTLFSGNAYFLTGLTIATPTFTRAFRNTRPSNQMSARTPFVVPGAVDKLDVRNAIVGPATIDVDGSPVKATVVRSTLKGTGILQLTGTLTTSYTSKRLPLKLDLQASGLVNGDPLELDLQLDLRSLDPV